MGSDLADDHNKDYRTHNAGHVKPNMQKRVTFRIRQNVLAGPLPMDTETAIRDPRDRGPDFQDFLQPVPLPDEHRL
jgi:hypothetical protein